MNSYRFEIPTEGMSPGNLFMIFVDNQFYARIAVSWLAAYRWTVTMPFIVKIDCDVGSMVTMYTGRAKVVGHIVGEFQELKKETNHNRKEIQQDLMAIGAWDKFPELEGMV